MLKQSKKNKMKKGKKQKVKKSTSFRIMCNSGTNFVENIMEKAITKVYKLPLKFYSYFIRPMNK